jgi:HSP20 family protein
MRNFAILKGNDDSLGFYDPFFDGFLGNPMIKGDRRHELMKTDIKDEGTHFLLQIDVPSVNKENIKLAFEEGYLTVSIEQNGNNDQKDKAGNYIRRERYYGSYERSYFLGEGIKESDISAKLDKGTLEVSVKKAEEAKEPTKKFITIQ